MTDKTDWLAGLQVGDEVVEMTSHIGAFGDLTTVTRVTTTQIVTTSGSRFRRKSGHGVGESGRVFTWIKEPTREREVAIKRDTALKAVEAIRWRDVPTAIQETVLALVTKALASKHRKAKR